MLQAIKQKIKDFPLLGRIKSFLKNIHLSGGGFSLYDLLKLYTVGIINGALSYRASSISYSFFVAIFPFLLVVLNLIPYVPIQDFQQDFWLFIDGFLPPGTHRFFEEIFFDIAQKKRAGLLSSVFVLSLFLTTNGINAIFGGFEYSYHNKQSRGAVKLYFLAMGVALLLIFLLLFSVILLIAFEVYVVENLERQGILQANSEIILWGKRGYFIFMSLLAISILFRFGSSQRGIRFFSPGSFLTVILVVLTTYLFGVYIENFAQYNQLYGSIGALLIFLLYIWLNSTIILLGFELNAALARLKKQKDLRRKNQG